MSTGIGISLKSSLIGVRNAGLGSKRSDGDAHNSRPRSVLNRQCVITCASNQPSQGEPVHIDEPPLAAEEVAVEETPLVAEQSPVVVEQQQPAIAIPQPTSIPDIQPSVIDPNGWVLAFSVLAAARLGRTTAQEARIDIRLVQQEREQNRAFSKELRQKREEWLQKETARKLNEDAQRVVEAAERAKEIARIERERQIKYQQEVAVEAARIRQEREAQKKLYETEQAKLDAEYQARVEQERKIIEEQRERARQEEERKRKEEEERKRQLEEERRLREEQERKEREEAIRRKIEERKRLEKEKQMFAVRIEGSVTVQKAPPGTYIPGPLEKLASIQVVVNASTLLGGAVPEAMGVYASTSDADDDLPRLIGSQIKAATDACASAIRVQAMTGSGPLQVMSEVELQHWMCLAGGRAMLTGLGAVGHGTASPTSATFQSRTEYGVLPADHPKRTDTTLKRVVSIIEGGGGQSEVHTALEDVLEVDNTIFYTGLDGDNSPRCIGYAFTLAHLLAVMLDDRPAKVSDAPAWFEGAVGLVRQELRELVAGAPIDSLELPAIVVNTFLGGNQPVAIEMAALAQANQSAAVKQQRQEKERRRQAELAAKLLEEEWPDEEEMKAARMADKEAKTPVPERVWALKNVAGTLAMGGAGERAKARQLLEQAVLLKQQYAGAPDHPAALPELIALGSLLASEPDWAKDASGVAALILKAFKNTASAFEADGDQVSAVIILEAALRQHEEAAGVKSTPVRIVTNYADKLLESMPAEDRETVGAHRRLAEAVLSKVVGAFNEELGAYKQGIESSKLDEWNQRKSRLIGPIRLV